jgi:sulfur-oxidizing protein SoxA
VVKGAFVELPRWFADTGKVQDLESRLVTCMSTLQGFDPKEVINGQWGKGERANVTALATWIGAQSKGMKINLPQGTRRSADVRGGQAPVLPARRPHDFACASCHGEEGKRIRLQDLPNLTGTRATASALPPGRPTASPAARCGACSAA